METDVINASPTKKKLSRLNIKSARPETANGVRVVPLIEPTTPTSTHAPSSPYASPYRLSKRRLNVFEHGSGEMQSPTKPKRKKTLDVQDLVETEVPIESIWKKVRLKS